MHSFTGQKIAGQLVVIGAVEVILADLSRFFGIEIREGGGVGADVCLDGVGEHVHSRVGSDACGNALDHLNVKDRFLREELLVDNGVLYVLFGVGDDREGGYLATRAAGGGDGYEVGEIVGLDLVCELTDAFAEVDCRAAADGDDAGSLFLKKRGNARAHSLHRGVGGNVGIYSISDLCSIKVLGDLLDKTAGYHEGVSDDEDLFIFKSGETGKGVCAEMN